MSYLSGINNYDIDKNEEKREICKIKIDIKNIYNNECDIYINIFIGNKRNQNSRYHIELFYRNVKFDTPLYMMSKRDIAISFLDEKTKDEIKWITTNIVEIKDTEK